MEISEEHKEYLKCKHQGGVNNSKGNTYEVIYATKEIVRLFASGVDINSTYIGTQIDGVFVDDLHIMMEETKTYIQLKDKKNLAWGKLNKGDIMYDFYWQSSYSQAANENFQLKIVYSQLDCPIHSTEIPQEIAKVTLKEFFPSFQNLTMLLQESKELRDNLHAIMNYPGDTLPLDMQSASVEFIKSQFLELAMPNRLVSLGEIREAYERKHPECPNFKDSTNVFLPNELLEIFKSFVQFSFTISGNTLYWKYKRMDGTTILTPELISRICEIRPREIFELITLLN